MCEWSDEENEQLNRMKVSDVEGDQERVRCVPSLGR
jgi:hypothetical protein